MIFVDVYVPSLDKEYDFHLDETVTVDTLIREMAEIISQKEQCEIIGNKKDFMLCLQEKEKILPFHMTLQECGVHTGSRIILA